MLTKNIKTKGFTIIEMIVVIVLIAILAGSVYSRSVETGERAKYSRANYEILTISDAVRVVYAEMTADNEIFGPVHTGKTGGDIKDVFANEKTAMLIQSKLTRQFSTITDPWGNPYVLTYTEGTEASGDVKATPDILELACMNNGEVRKDIYSVAPNAVLRAYMYFYE